MVLSNGINGTTSIKLTKDNWVIPGAVVDIDYAGHYSLGYVGATEDLTPLVEYVDHIPVPDTPLFSSRGVNPRWFVEVSIRTPNLARFNFM